MAGHLRPRRGRDRGRGVRSGPLRSLTCRRGTATAGCSASWAAPGTWPCPTARRWCSSCSRSVATIGLGNKAREVLLPRHRLRARRGGPLRHRRGRQLRHHHRHAAAVRHRRSRSSCVGGAVTGVHRRHRRAAEPGQRVLRDDPALGPAVPGRRPDRHQVRRAVRAARGHRHRDQPHLRPAGDRERPGPRAQLPGPGGRRRPAGAVPRPPRRERRPRAPTRRQTARKHPRKARNHRRRARTRGGQDGARPATPALASAGAAQADSSAPAPPHAADPQVAQRDAGRQPS